MKIFTILYFSILFFSSQCFTQITFNKLLDLGYPTELITSVLPTDSCYYTTGLMIDSTDTYTVGNIFNKHDLEGNVIFSKKISNPNKSYQTWLGDLQNFSESGFIDVGYSVDSVRGGIIIVYNENGDTMKTSEYYNLDTSNHDFILPVKILPYDNNGYAILNNYWINENGFEKVRMSLVVIDSNLTIKKYFTFADPNFTNLQHIPNSLIIDDDGGFIIGGIVQSLDPYSTMPRRQTYIFKSDTSGIVKWSYLSPINTLRFRAYDMLKTSDGSLVYTSGIGEELETNASSSIVIWDATITKIDAERNLVWETPFRGYMPTNFVLTSLKHIIEAPDGSGYVAAGQIADDQTPGGPFRGSVIVKASPEGDSLWARYYSVFEGLYDDPVLYDFKPTSDGGYIIGGQTTSTFPDTVIRRAWLMKVDEYGCLVPGCQDIIIDAVEEENESLLQAKIYPNPTSDFLNIFVKQRHHQTNLTFRIYDGLGRLLRTFSNSFPEETLMVNVQDYAAGIYYLEISAEGEKLKTERFAVKK